MPFTPADAGSTGGIWSGGGANIGGDGFGGDGHTGGEWTGGTFGVGGEPQVAEPEVVVGAGSNVVGIHVTDDRIYWLSHGTFDVETSLSNGDGAISRTGVNGGVVEVIAGGLDRPVRLGATDLAAYIWLEESQTLEYSGFIEVNLEFGSWEPIDVGAAPALFTAFADKAYISHESDEDSGVFEHVLGEEPRQVVWGMPTDIAANLTHIYFTTEAGDLFRAPLDTPTATELLGSGIIRGFDLWQDRVLVLEENALRAMPQEGGPLSTYVILPDDRTYADLRVAGHRYFVAQLLDDGSHSIHTGEILYGNFQELWQLHPAQGAWLGTYSELYVGVGTFVQRIQLD